MLLLRRELGVRQLVDFRSADEHKEDSAWSLMLSNGVMRTYDPAGGVAEVSAGAGLPPPLPGGRRGAAAASLLQPGAALRPPAAAACAARLVPPTAAAPCPPAGQESVDHNAALAGVDLADIQLHRISLLERSRVMRGMARRAPACCTIERAACLSRALPLLQEAMRWRWQFSAGLPIPRVPSSPLPQQAAVVHAAVGGLVQAAGR